VATRGSARTPSTEVGEDLAEDPLPFGPIVPEEPLADSELISREDPLGVMLDGMQIDAVLSRYGLHGRRQRQPLPAVAVASLAAARLAEEAEAEAEAEGAAGKLAEVSLMSSSLRAGHSESQTLQRLSATSSGARRAAGAPGRERGRRNPLGPGAFSTLAKTRGIADPVGQMRGAPERSARQQSQGPGNGTAAGLSKVVERSNTGLSEHD